MRQPLRLLRPEAVWIGAVVVLGVATIGSGLGLVGTAAFLIATAALQPSIAALQVAIVGVRFFGIAVAVARYLERLVAHGLTLRLLQRLRVWFFRRLEPLAPARTLQLRSGELLARMVGDVESLQELVVRAVGPPLVAVVTAAGVAAWVAGRDRGLGVAVLGFLAAAGVLVPMLVRQLNRAAGARLARARGALEVAVVDAVQGMADLVASGRGAEQSRAVERAGARLGQAQWRRSVAGALGSGLLTLLTHLGMWTVLVLAIPMVNSGRFDGVTLTVVCVLVVASFDAVAPLSAVALALDSQLAALRRVTDVLEVEPAVSDVAEPTALGLSAAGGLGLELDGVHFAYPGTGVPALAGVTLRLAAGCRAGLVGPSGAGKSTLVSLLLRFWDPDAGAIRLGGHDLRQLHQDELRRLVGVLAQRSHLFAGTIRRNLQLARPGADEAALWHALAQAGLAAEVESFAEGLDTWVGEHGMRLSGGQRQRLALARSVLLDPPVLVLDEPLVHLDAVASARLWQTLEELTAGRTTLYISHRLAQVRRMDSIVVMDQGRVVEQGTHAELLDAGGLYSAMWEWERQALPRL